MKLFETNFVIRRKYEIIMILSFLFGGFMLFLFFLNSYTDIWITNTPDFNEFSDRNFDENNQPRWSFLRTYGQPRQINPLTRISSPISLLLLTGGIISLLAGLTISSLTKKKEAKKIKQTITDNLLLPDEKAIINSLKSSDYEMTQSKLSKSSGLNKVQAHRAIKRLKNKGVLEKHSFGTTNKIILKKEYFE